MRTGDLEALRRAFASGSVVPPAPEECPDPGTIWLAVRRELPARRLRGVVEHLAACPSCTEEWRLALAFEGSPDEAEAAQEPEPAWWRGLVHPLPVWLAAAGTAAALFIGTVLLRAPVPVLRGGPAAVSAPQLVAADARSRESCLLLWSGPPGAVYDVEVRTPSGHVVSRARGLTTGRYQVPAADLAPFPPGTVLRWQVSATLPGGRRSVSKVGTLTLR
jgi:hypothetical protein